MNVPTQVTIIVGGGVGINIANGGGAGVWFGEEININNNNLTRSSCSVLKLKNACIALQAQKSAIIDDPLGVLKTWNGSDYEELLPILRWTSICRTQDGKTLKRLQNSISRTRSSTDTTLGSINTTRTSIDRTHSSVQGSFGLGSLPIPWSDLPIQLEFYRYLENFYQNKSRQ
ncbi:hypothetical protein Gogos_016887 [Gossypium gossypioides]|uniref:Uncharacterized protein n=1 Tax=Gossypium gossypioides TaxID=34282 RepID=A0A7J9BB53_GOSGO|nr:hypothetical protein [Gossypium gossypioides]